jgi:hypothetical protein
MVWVSNSNLTLGILHTFGSKLKFCSGYFANFGGLLGPFGVQGLKIKFYSWGIFLFGESPNSCALKSVSTNSWLSVAYLFSIIHRTPLVWHLRMGKRPRSEVYNWGYKDGQTPQGKIIVRNPNDGKTTKQKFEFSPLTPKGPSLDSKMCKSHG